MQSPTEGVAGFAPIRLRSPRGDATRRICPVSVPETTFLGRETKSKIGANGSDRLCYAGFGASVVPVRSQIKGRPGARHRLPLAVLDLGPQMAAEGDSQRPTAFSLSASSPRMTPLARPRCYRRFRDARPRDGMAVVVESRHN